MQRITVSRDDGVYEAFADIACAADGTLVCTYRESLCHGPWPFSRIIVRRSVDAGLTWGPRQLVIERDEARTAAGEGRQNCFRILCLADDRRTFEAWEVGGVRDIVVGRLWRRLLALQRFLFQPDPHPSASAWTLISGPYGRRWEQAPDGYWPSGSAAPEAVAR